MKKITIVSKYFTYAKLLTLNPMKMPHFIDEQTETEK